jgi:hypothetical protein
MDIHYSHITFNFHRITGFTLFFAEPDPNAEQDAEVEGWY